MALAPPQVRDFTVPSNSLRIDGVFVNGVRQAEGRDYRVEGSVIRFERGLVRHIRFGALDWILTALCAGVEAEGDSVDAIIATPAGRTSVTLEPADVIHVPATAPPAAAR